MKGIAIVSAAGAVMLAAVVAAYVSVAQTAVASPVQPGPIVPAESSLVPPVKGYAEGQEIWFLHTETSDSIVAEVLTEMMGPQVLAVPALAQAPKAMLARVYVFRNGIKGGGTLRFQPDVFDHPPGDPAYSPLRTVTVVTWKNTRSARVLKAAAEVQAAYARRDLDIDELGVVVNMPLITWPGGQR